ncbi:zinc finger protein ZPR1-like [Ostrea edulis]|uniref:zinc finger protein ZPR1-like n=1 Tax=Ostrea edulis TaxID=37623 RepID=UPI0020947383|nr:zinc finger protein ZPR1-like [Ostrea edulis]XP_048773275.1 zinc finger protein ZPR1-like [Ostrea edulis]
MSTEDSSTVKSLYRDINADDEDPEIMEIESYCVNCEQNGMTRLFLTRIPFFKDVLVSSFTCDNCGLHNTELQPGGKIQEKGVKFVCTINTVKDLNRQIVQTNYATVSIPKLEFESPPNKGVLTTVEGLIQRAVEGLLQDQPVRKIQHPEVAAQIDSFIDKLKDLKAVKEPFQIVLDDPSGNSFIENPFAPNVDKDMTIHHYKRSRAQDDQLGLLEQEKAEQEPEKGENPEISDEALFDAKSEVATFRSNCPSCNVPCDTNMKMVDIPHFKEVVIMATICNACGYKDNEVKGGSGIEPKGTKITLKITDPSDMSRDVLKSDTASMRIPELDFDAEMGTLGGKFTTLEGLLENIKDQLSDSNPFFGGDTSDKKTADKIELFCKEIQKIISGERLGDHFILDDPAGNSYLQNVYAPDPDPEMTVEQYERNYEQNEDLGLNDMKTENYETS